MDFNRIKEMGKEYVEKGKAAALDLTEKGKVQAKLISQQSKLAKAQRQLGALVYSLAKGNEENQPLVDKYIDAIGAIEQEIEQLKSAMTPAEQEADAVVEAEVKTCTCPQCGAELEADTLFCSKCGAQI